MERRDKRRDDGNQPLSFGGVSNAFRTGELPSAIKEFVEPGEDIGSLLMRTVLEDNTRVTAGTMFLKRCRKYGLEDHERLFFDFLALSCSVKGRARIELLQAVVGMLAPSMMGVFKRKPKEEIIKE